MTGESPGIRANRIEAENVVEGVQVRGDANPQDLVELARTIRRGGIDAQTILATNVVSGLQYIRDPEHATVEDLHSEVAALRTQLAGLAEEYPGSSQVELSDATSALDVAEAELGSDKPAGGRIVRKLREAADAITAAAESSEAAGRLMDGLSRLAPVAAAVASVATSIFGG